MVKVRPGSRKGQTRWVSSAYKASKKRAGRLGKSTTPKRTVIHDAMRKAWDERETPATNLKRLGLLSNINKVRKSAVTTKRIAQLKNGLKTDGDHGVDISMDVDKEVCEEVRGQLEQHASMPERGTKQIVRPGECVALQRMVDKYGFDWVKMARDVKLNYLQWSPSQLQKKVERMQSLTKKKK